MKSHWFKNPRTVIFAPLALALVLVIACGSASQPETAAQQPASEQPAA
jgi:outer membrane lipoprotein-sorting protein